MTLATPSLLAIVPPPAEPRGFPVKRLATLYGFSVREIQRRIKDGSLRALRSGKRNYVVLAVDWEDFLRRCRVVPGGDK